MQLEDIIRPNSVLCNAHARSKKHSIEILSELLGSSTSEFAAEDIFERLVQRERLGCTSLMTGVAFPHCRIEGLEESFAAMIKLSEPVDFDAPDGEPVDLIFGMLVPKELDESHHADIATGNEGLEEKTVISFNAFGDFAMNIVFIYYIRKGADIMGVQSEINNEILRRFNDRGLEFAFPTQTIYTKSD